MLKQHAYKFRLSPALEQESLFRQFAGCSRFVWNLALALQKERLDQKEGILRYNKLALLLPQWKKEHPFLKEVHSQPLQQTLKDLDKTFARFFDPKLQAGFPRFKKKGQHDAFRFPQGFKLNGNRIYLPKLGWVKFKKSREIEGTVRNVTISCSAGKWYVALQCQQEIEQLVPQATSIIGGDMGVAKFLTLSDGTMFFPITALAQWERVLKREQRKLSHKQKFSRNWRKQKARIARIHSKIANIRRDALHKTSTILSKNHAIVVLEELKVQNMTASARGTQDAPGRNMKQKAGLNQGILEQGWYEFRRQLAYKLAWTGGQLLLVPPQYTSQACSECGHVHADNRKSQAHFECVQCGHVENADVNAAKNILRAGHARLACSDSRKAA
jgi:putative transposase